MNMKGSQFEKYILKKKKIIDDEIERFLANKKDCSEKIHKAIRYSLFPGGKRLRAIFVMETAKIFGDEKNVMPCAVAIELIHNYSLIHDDLPCMDNDDIRRNKPTLHKVFGEAIAVLTGDALQSLEFEILSREQVKFTKDLRKVIRVIDEITTAIGPSGMVKGQVLDITFDKEVSQKILNFISLNKTGKLIRTSICCGAILSGAKDDKIIELSKFGEKFGIAFQIIDDIKDKDNKKDRFNYVNLLGEEKARKLSDRLLLQAKNSLDIFEDRGKNLKLLVDYLKT